MRVRGLELRANHRTSVEHIHSVEVAVNAVLLEVLVDTNVVHVTVQKVRSVEDARVHHRKAAWNVRGRRCSASGWKNARGRLRDCGGRGGAWRIGAQELRPQRVGKILLGEINELRVFIRNACVSCGG